MSGGIRSAGGSNPFSNWKAILAVVAGAVLLFLILKPGKESSDFFVDPVAGDPVADAEMAHSLLLAQIDAAQPGPLVSPPGEGPSDVAIIGSAQTGGEITLSRDLFKAPGQKPVKTKSGNPKPKKVKRNSHADSPHKLSAILIDGVKRQAFFGGHHIVEAGDEMHGYTVVAITDSSVTLLKGGEELAIKMGAK